MPAKTYPELRWTSEMVDRFWDWQSQYPENYFTYNFGGEIARTLRHYLSGRQKVLDFGCGVGYLLPHLCARADKVFGADPSPESVARTNERLVGTPSFEGAFLISELREKGARFDAIIVVEVIEHLYDDALDSIMADISDMLAPGGVVIFSTPNDEDLKKSMLLNPTTGEVYHRWQHVRSWNTESLAKWFRAKGFEPVDIFTTNFSISKRSAPRDLLKRLAKRVLMGNQGKPHLVGVAKLAERK